MIDYIEAHKYSSHHKDELLKDDLCGCFYCLKIFHPREIKTWLEDEGTAVYPYCEIDSVIGKYAGYELNEENLRKMKKYWFDE